MLVKVYRHLKEIIAILSARKLQYLHCFEC